MKKQTIFKTLLAFAVILGASSFTFQSTLTTLKVKVTGIRSADGDVHVLIFNKAMGFPMNEEMAYRHVKCKVAKGEVTIDMANIPSGKYAIVSFHDFDSNNRFDKSWFGSPKEDYGFSNIPGEYCGTPSFQQTSFDANATNSSISVKLMNIK